MYCPKCSGIELEAVLTRQGIEVERCPRCQGIWLDRGELFLFADDPEAVTERLRQAMRTRRPAPLLSPQSGQAMEEITYPGEVVIDYCPSSGGLWFDEKELRAALARDRDLHLEIDHSSLARRHAAATAALLPLPNLLLRSTLTLAGLYAVLGAVTIAAAEFAGLGLEWAVGAALAVMALQFLIGPFIMDLSLRWLYRMRWLTPAQLPAHLRDFMERVCREQKIRLPHLGMIEDGAPQAFTYGHSPNNARIVISRGLLELLEEEEAQAVVAHEIGHAVHWDMFLMTVAQMVPLLLYYLYRSLIRAARSRDDKKGGGGVAVIAIGAYLLYIVSEYAVLWFSRTREYHADRFAGEVTGNPSLLASALAKIGYGLAGQAASDEATPERNARLDAVGALGIFDRDTATSMAIAGYSRGIRAGEIDKTRLKGAMRWDLWNPWAKWFELNSTHPLIAKRLRYLSNQAALQGQEPFILFDEAQPESYWDEFFDDLVVYLLPAIALVLAPLALGAVLGFEGNGARLLGAALAAFGAALLVRFAYSYRGGFYPEMSVAALLKRVKVSAVRPVPCTLRGTVIGRGVPGYIFSEDFVIRDETGIMFLDLRQPLGLWEAFFGLLRAERYQGREVTVEGWYRRAPVPYVEIRRLTAGDDTVRSWAPFCYALTAAALLAAGAVIGLTPEAVWAWIDANCEFHFVGFECD